MQKMNVFISALIAGGILGLSGCVAEKNTNSELSLTPTDAKYLNSADLKELFTGKTTPWKSLKNESSGVNNYNSDGTYSRIRTWRVTEDGYKCNVGGKKERCLKIYKKGEEYVGVNRNGEDLYQFTARSNDEGKIISITPASGKFLSTGEVKQLYSGATTSWIYLLKDQAGKTTYNTDGTYSSIRGTWKITDDGFKCQTQMRNNKERCGRVFQDGSMYYLVNKKGSRIYSFTVQ